MGMRSFPREPSDPVLTTSCQESAGWETQAEEGAHEPVAGTVGMGGAASPIPSRKTPQRGRDARVDDSASSTPLRLCPWAPSASLWRKPTMNRTPFGTVGAALWILA